MKKEVYNIRLIEKQFKSMSKVMKAITETPSGGTMEGPISVTLTHGQQTMTLTMSKNDHDQENL